jgi:hypothetical protein
MAGFNLFVHGDLYQKDDVSLFVNGKEYIYDYLELFHSGQTPIVEHLDLYCSGDRFVYSSVPLHTITGLKFNNPLSGGGVAGGDEDEEDQEPSFLPITVTSAENTITTEDNPYLKLHIETEDLPGVSIDNFLNISLAVSDTIPATSSLVMSVWYLPFTPVYEDQASLPLTVYGFVDKLSTNSSMPLYIDNHVTVTDHSDSLNLFVANDYIIKWDSDDPGLDIALDDEKYASVPATDAIRGVSLSCYGNCDIGTCQDVSVETHDTVWFDPVCVDGGIIRPADVYTNLDESAFGSNVPYSGHFYGMRKIDGLLPLQKYYVNVFGRSGSDVKITAPKELSSWEYTIDGSDVAYSGLKLIGDSPSVSGGRNAGDKYGSSLSMNGDLLAVGSPYMDINHTHKVLDSDPTSHTLQDAGTVFLYRRGPEPELDSIVQNKAGWDFEAQLSLPSGIIRDHYVDTPATQEDGIDIILRTWKLGQEGRNFGSDVQAYSISNQDPWITQDTRELVAVAAPNAAWSRTFPPLTTIENDILFFVFTDEFLPSFTVVINRQEYTLTYRDVVESVTSKNLLYTYYSLPTISLSIKIVIFHPIDPDIQPSPDFPEPKPSFIQKVPITRHRNERLNSQEFLDVDDEIFDQIKDTFEDLYPIAGGKIPAILGVYVDNSRSLGSAAVEPALTRFKDYYQSYSFNNGLTLHDNTTPASGAVLSTTSLDENWILQTKTLIDFTLDSGRLAQQDYLKLLTDPAGFGQFNENLSEFNIPPSSGGCVYLFEKESGSWNLIQEINSPTLDNDIPADLFGTAIKLSEDGSILAIGSPYINEAVTIYERDPSEQNRMYSNLESWADYYLEKDEFDEYHGQIKFNIEVLRASGNLPDGDSGVYREVFLNYLSHQEKYDYRNDSEYWGEDIIKEYKHNFTYRYTDIDYKGTYKALIEEFAPTSRMGYSVAVEDSGNAVAFGCPTDSLDEFDDTNTYYHPTNSGQILWPSYVNAGAVRVLDSVKYFKHNKVVEYSKFGNLDRDTYKDSYPEAFEHFGSVFSDLGKTFERTDFNDFEIPEDAGVLMIICPEVDFSNVEVMNRIKNWLDLGDRNLVLVGNDGNFEKSGRFRKTNPILNNVLTKLDSSMRLVSAPSKFNALTHEENTCPTRPNILPSYRPENSIDSYIEIPESGIFGNGVADIRIHAPDIYEYYSCTETYRQNNKYCSPPLANSGDLRTFWNDEDGVKNWPNLFSEHFPNRKPPVPLMIAGYYKEPLVVDIPAIPPISGLIRYYDEVQTGVAPAYGKSLISDTKFGWSESLTLYNSLDTNVGLNSNTNRFVNPEYKMTVDAVMQSKSSNGVDIVVGEEEVSDPCHLAGVEKIPSYNNNNLYLVATLYTESVEVLYSGLGDKNINFYFNIVAKNSFGSSYIAQINSFSGRSDFKDANPDSVLELIFRNTGNTVSTNVSLSQLISGHPDGNRYNVCWIANPVNIPSEDEIKTIKKWLKQDGKKIVITYDNDASAKSAEALCEALGNTMKPLYLANRSRFANSFRDVISEDQDFYFTPRFLASPDRYYPRINPLNSAIRYGFVPSRDSVSQLTMDSRYETFIPVDLQSGLSIASLGHGVADDRLYDLGFYYMKSGTAKISFPVESNKAYRLFFNAAAFSEYEKEPLNIYITNCNELPSFTTPFVPPEQDVFNINSDDTISSVFKGPIGLVGQIGGRERQRSFIQQYVFNIQALEGAEEIEVFITGSNSRIRSSYDKQPSTVALISVSGALVDIVESPVNQLVARYEWEITDPGSEAFTTTVEFPEPFPIQSNSSKYCPGNLEFFELDDCSKIFNESLIEDGPVVVAQEIYYNNLTNQGINPSRITVISDASMIEGPCIFISGEVRDEQAKFIRSLYPDTVFPENDNSKFFSSTEMTKIISPERSSPARLFAGVGNSGLIERFIPDNSQVVNSGNLISIFKETTDYSEVQRPELLEEEKQAVFDAFRDSQVYYGSNSKFNYDIGGVIYRDAGSAGGRPPVIDVYGADFIDYDVFPSGYPGDLFGFSIDYHRGKLVVGSPFAAYQGEEAVSWDSVVAETEQYEPSFGTLVSRNGGAGSVYIYENTGEGLTLSQENKRWEFKSKLRPKSINVGQDLDDTIESTLIEHLGENNYSLDELLKYSTFTDQFGHYVKIYSDLIAVGAPGHDYSINPDTPETIFASGGAYEFKSFNFEFDAKSRELIDYGDPDLRAIIGLVSGVMNNGAVYTFENRIISARTKEQSWVMVEKLIPDGYNARLQQGYDEIAQVVASGTENEHFGENIALYRARRSDADYTIAIGTPHHKFATSGTHITGDLEDAGAAFLFDAMLRDTPPFLADSGCFIEANVFGYPSRKVSIRIDNSSLDTRSYSSGFVYSNRQGEIFVEASGQDRNLAGFSIHRPSITAVYGRIVDEGGSHEDNSISLYTNSVVGISNENMPLYCFTPDVANVYSSVVLYTDAIGLSDDNSISLYTQSLPGDILTENLGMHTSGIASMDTNFTLYSSGY